MKSSRAGVALIALLATVACAGAGVSSRPPAQDRAEGVAARSASGAWLEIDVGAFANNIRVLQAKVGARTKICAIMKADAYGHGIKLLIPAVVAADLPCVGIVGNEEARAVRAGGFQRQLIRIRSATLDEIEQGLRWNIEELAGNLHDTRLVAELGRKHGRILRVHINLNSGGMSRNEIDVSTDAGKHEVLEIGRLPGLSIVGIMTHFPVEDRTDVLRGLDLFKSHAAWVVENAHLDRHKITLHCANSFATLAVQESRLDMVRPGGALYGDTVVEYAPELERVMRFKSRVASVQSYPAGRSVGYDRTLVLGRDSRLATVAAGYANGYPRTFSRPVHVLIRGRRCPVVGKVSMNVLTVDVTDASEVGTGDEVVLFGRQGSGEITQREIEDGTGRILAEMYTIWGTSNPRVVTGNSLARRGP